MLHGWKRPGDGYIARGPQHCQGQQQSKYPARYQQWEVLLGCKSGTVFASRFCHSFLVWRVNHNIEVSHYNTMTVGSHDIDQNLINSQIKCFFGTNNYYNMHSINTYTNLRVVIQFKYKLIKFLQSICQWKGHTCTAILLFIMFVAHYLVNVPWKKPLPRWWMPRKETHAKQNGQAENWNI